MPVNIIVPPLSQTLDTLVLVEWLKNVGDPIQKGEPLFTVETDKATLDVEAPADGILESVSAGAGDEVQIHGVIGRIRESGEPGETVNLALPGELDLQERNAPTERNGPTERNAPTERRIFASPRARQLLSRKGLRLEELEGIGTGPQGMIVERDVRAYLEQNKLRLTPVAQRMAQEAGLDPDSLLHSHKGELIRKADIEASLARTDEKVEVSGRDIQDGEDPARKGKPLSNIRKVIAARMSESHQTSAPVTYLSEVDATRLVKLRKHILKELSGSETRPTLTDFIIRITTFVLKNHPQLNATFDGSLLNISESIHIALAVDTERGLVVPVISNAGQMGLSEIARTRSRLVQKALNGDLKQDEMNGGTFTISNLGTLGIDHFTPIINPPQVAILGVGRVREVPAIRKGKLRCRYSMGLSVTCDHRIIDGAPAARFLNDICRMVEEPDLIWL
jgi:pyruvate dehydrogenase E2 component (dihydrolipoamide acetyltransferase)